MDISSLEDTLKPLSGRLVPLPTAQEARPKYEEAEAYVAEIGVQSASKVVKLLNSTFPRDSELNRPHLRRFAKPEHLPERLRPRGESKPADATTTKSIYILIPPPLPERSELETLLSPHAPINSSSISDSSVERPPICIQSTRIPLHPPLSAEQAHEWSRSLWPTTYNPAAQPASHAPPPTILSRVQSSLEPLAGTYLALARRLGDETHRSGRGRNIGVVVVDPELLKRDTSNPLAAIVAVSGDARYHNPSSSEGEQIPTDTYTADHEGRPDQHALMRAISIVSHKRLQQQQASESQQPPSPAISPPLSALESHFFNTSNLPAGGYLCTSLDVYTTHEPCVCCAMGMLLSRFRSVIVARKARSAGKGSVGASLSVDGEAGYGLHWRAELNWRAMGFEFVEDGVGAERIEDGDFQFHA